MHLNFLSFIVVGTGGFIGAMLRYGISSLIRIFNFSFPISTITVNFLGSFLIGFVSAKNPNYYITLFLIPGILGGFTTFSAFSYETVTLLKSNQWIEALTYVGLHLVLGILGVSLGDWVSQKV